MFVLHFRGEIIECEPEREMKVRIWFVTTGTICSQIAFHIERKWQKTTILRNSRYCYIKHFSKSFFFIWLEVFPLCVALSRTLDTTIGKVIAEFRVDWTMFCGKYIKNCYKKSWANKSGRCFQFDGIFSRKLFS